MMQTGAIASFACNFGLLLQLVQSATNLIGCTLHKVQGLLLLGSDNGKRARHAIVGASGPGVSVANSF
jgi:hypothetical protein